MRLASVHRRADIPSGHALRLARRTPAMMNPLLAPELLRAHQQKLLREAELDRLARAAQAEMPRTRVGLLASLAEFLALLARARRASRGTELAAPTMLPPVQVATPASAPPVHQ
jgi:hypothetical protein